MSQRQQLERILAIDSQIRNGAFPHPDSLAQELEVSRRVVFNDRKFLVERLGAPLAYHRKKGGWYYTDATWMLPTALITEGELLAFILGVEAARRYVGTAFEAALLRTMEKITRSLQGPVGVDLESLRRHCTFSHPAVIRVEEKTMAALCSALQDRRSVRVNYYSAESNVTRTHILDPYHLHNVNGNWYLFAFEQNWGRVFTFHVGRIHSLQILNQSFEPLPNFDAAQRVADMLGAEAGDEVLHVAIRFNDYQASFMRDREFHPSQQIEELPDGGLILRFQTSSWGEVTRFILQYGSNAEVLEPTDLREEIIQEVQAMARLYGQEVACRQREEYS
jgi:predicted DNA-binding transcriptional regulator YafY